MPENPNLRERIADLREAIWLNEGLLDEQRAIAQNGARWIEAKEKRIADLQSEIDQVREKMTIAPDRVKRIEAKLVRQREVLARLRAEANPPTQAEAVAKLAKALVEGREGALEPLQKLITRKISPAEALREAGLDGAGG
jgi:chromosome segregation ATPase